MARARSADPIQQFRFRVEIEGVSELGFQRVSGLETEYEVAEYREGGFDHTHKLPGIEQTNPVTLERGATSNRELYDWYRSMLYEGAERTTVSIIELDYAGNEVKRYVLSNAWASQFTAPEMDGTSSEVAVESVEIQYESLELE